MCCLTDFCQRLLLCKVLYSSLLLHECVILVAQSPEPVILGADCWFTLWKITDDFICLSCCPIKTSSSQRARPQHLLEVKSFQLFLIKLSMWNHQLYCKNEAFSRSSMIPGWVLFSGKFQCFYIKKEDSFLTKHLLLPTSNAEFAREYMYLSVREESVGTAVHA